MKDLRVFDTMKQASSIMGIPLDVLKAAKRKGCPNFRGGRIYREGLERWISLHSAEFKATDSSSKKERKLDEEIRRLKIANDTREGLLIPRAFVVTTHAKILGGLLPRLEQILTNEYPMLVVGLDAPQIRIKGRQVFDRILEEFRNAGELFQGW